MNEPEYVAIYLDDIGFVEKVKSNNVIAGFLRNKF